MRDDHQARARADLASNEQARFILAQMAKRIRTIDRATTRPRSTVANLLAKVHRDHTHS